MTGKSKEDTSQEQVGFDRNICLRSGEEILIHRASKKDKSREPAKDNLVFVNSHLSKVHASIKNCDNIFYIKDCYSTFGTIINDKFVFPGRWVRLSNGDLVGFIVSKPSTTIANIKKKFSDMGATVIPLHQFSNAQIALRFKVKIDFNTLEFTFLEDKQSPKQSQSNFTDLDVTEDMRGDRTEGEFDNEIDLTSTLESGSDFTAGTLDTAHSDINLSSGKESAVNPSEADKTINYSLNPEVAADFSIIRTCISDVHDNKDIRFSTEPSDESDVTTGSKPGFSVINSSDCKAYGTYKEENINVDDENENVNADGNGNDGENAEVEDADEVDEEDEEDEEINEIENEDEGINEIKDEYSECDDDDDNDDDSEVDNDEGDDDDDDVDVDDDSEVEVELEERNSEDNKILGDLKNPCRNLNISIYQDTVYKDDKICECDSEFECICSEVNEIESDDIESDDIDIDIDIESDDIESDSDGDSNGDSDGSDSDGDSDSVVFNVNDDNDLGSESDAVHHKELIVMGDEKLFDGKDHSNVGSFLRYYKTDETSQPAITLSKRMDTTSSCLGVPSSDLHIEGNDNSFGKFNTTRLETPSFGDISPLDTGIENYYSQTSKTKSIEGNRKRVFDETADDSEIVESSPKRFQSERSPKYAPILKELLKGSVYAFATILALGAYGSTITPRQ